MFIWIVSATKKSETLILKIILLSFYAFSDELVHANTPLDDDKNEDGIMNHESRLITEFGLFHQYHLICNNQEHWSKNIWDQMYNEKEMKTLRYYLNYRCVAIYTHLTKPTSEQVSFPRQLSYQQKLSKTSSLRARKKSMLTSI